MMDSMESCVPPGFRFHPTDEELVGYYLRKKIASQKIDLDVIRDIDLYRIEPWDLQEKCRIGYEEQNEWYFFSHKDKKYPTGTRTNRATIAGFWKATGRDKAVYDKTKLIGMRKTLVFYKGRAPNGQKTDWIMHEYRLESDENGPPQEEGWVVCRAFKKRTTALTKTAEAWESSYFYDEPSGLSSVMDPTDHYNITTTQPPPPPQPPRQPPTFLPRNFFCKQEMEASDSLKFMQSDQCFHLPQLESPSLPITKKPSSISLVSDHNEDEEDEDEDGEDRIRGLRKDKNKVTDWRDLDKFVASQLSQDQERYEGGPGPCGGVSGFEEDCNSEMGLLLMQSDRGEGSNLNGFLSSSSEFDIGICIFDK